MKKFILSLALIMLFAVGISIAQVVVSPVVPAASGSSVDNDDFGTFNTQSALVVDRVNDTETIITTQTLRTSPEGISTVYIVEDRSTKSVVPEFTEQTILENSTGYVWLDVGWE